MPTTIKILLVLIASTFFIDQLSSFHDAHWEIAELSFDDPIYLGMSIMWFCIVVWLCVDTLRRKKHIPNTVLTLTILVSLFMTLEVFESEGEFNTLISFQALEVAIWAAVYAIAKYKVEAEWFTR